MKSLTILLCIFLMSGCASEEKKGDNSETDTSANTEVAAPQTVVPLPDQFQPQQEQPGQVNIPAGADGIVAHYVCPDQCGGVGIGAGACPQCGKVMSHNQAFHAQTTDAANPAVSPVQNPELPQNPEPPQNANGVWHYTCANGCAGGAGSAQACSGCGGTLAHNQAYHQ
ncbi:MAG: hypothetical protein GY751_11955 [Bacteroidetes bacterium]|nr:hypothetical protein [Bacteroidota bacterium]